MKEALYRVLTTTPIKIEISDKAEERSVDIEQYFRKRHIGSREDYKEVGIEIDGISGNDSGFFEQLEKNGMSFSLK